MGRCSRFLLYTLILFLWILQVYATEVDTDEYFKKVLKQEKVLCWEGDIVTVIYLKRGPLTSLEKKVKLKNRQAIIYQAPPILANTIFYIEGDKKIIIPPRKHILVITPFFCNTLIPALLKRNYRISFQEEEIVAKRLCEKVKLIPINKRNPYSIYWIDKEKKIILKEQKFNAEGKLVKEFFYTFIDFNPSLSSLPQLPYKKKKVDLTSRFSLCPSIKKAQEEAHFPIITPSFLPEGYELQKVIIHKLPKFTISQTVYSNGFNYFYIFQYFRGLESCSCIKNRSILRIFQESIGPQFLYSHLYKWTTGNFHLFIIADLTKEDIKKIVESGSSI